MKKKMGVFAAIKNTNKLQLKNNDLNKIFYFTIFRILIQISKLKLLHSQP